MMNNDCCLFVCIIIVVYILPLDNRIHCLFKSTVVNAIESTAYLEVP